MAMESDKTAYRVHAHSFSIIAVVAGFVAAIVVFAVLMFVFYDGQNNIDAAPATPTLTNSTNSSGPGR